MGIQYHLYMMNIPVSYDTSIRNNAWKKSVSRMPCNQYISRWTSISRAVAHSHVAYCMLIV